MYLLANSGANQRYANAYNQYGGYQGGSYSHYANRRMFDGERYLGKKEGYSKSQKFGMFCIIGFWWSFQIFFLWRLKFGQRGFEKRGSAAEAGLILKGDTLITNMTLRPKRFAVLSEGLKTDVGGKQWRGRDSATDR